MTTRKSTILTAEEQKETGDYSHLENKDEYTNYFRLVLVALSRVLEWIAIEGDGDAVVRSMNPMLNKLLYTINLLRIRFLFNPHHDLAVDLHESGFPHSAAFFALETDVQNRDKLFAETATIDKLKDSLIESLLNNGKSTAILEELGEASYITKLDRRELFTQFNPGQLVLLDCSNDNVRRYNFTWATYSTDTNVPYFHSLMFEQDSDRKPLESNGPDYDKLIETIRFCSQHTPRLGVVIYQIDDSIDWIHPKLIQRIQMGPLISLKTKHDESERGLIDLLRDYGDQDDFILELVTEVVISKGSQNEKSGIFSLGSKKVREIFFLPGDDLELYERKVSRVVKKLMIPHRVLQNVDRSAEYFAKYRAHGKITYTKGGNIHVH